MTGSEHRRALPSLPLAFVATIGSAQNETDHWLLTRAVRELVAVTNEIFSERCTGGGITGAQAAATAERAQKWVIDYYQPLLGPSHATNLHRLAVLCIYLTSSVCGEICSTGTRATMRRCTRQ